MVGMLISALYNAIDMYFVGALGLSQMGAVSVVFPIVQIIIGIMMFLEPVLLFQLLDFKWYMRHISLLLVKAP